MDEHGPEVERLVGVAMKSKLLRILAVGMVGMIGLAGCADSIPQPKPVTEVKEYPAIDSQRFGTIMKELGEQLEAAAKAGKADGASRLSDQAKHLWNSYHHFKDKAPVIPLEVKSVTTTNTIGWPRTIVAVATAKDDAKKASVLTFVQPDAKSQFKLDNWADLLPGEPFPATLKIETGAASIPQGSKDYLLDPYTVPEQYVKLLSGSDSQLKDKIADSKVTSRLKSDQSDLESAIDDSGSVSFTYSTANKEVATIALTQDGALAVSTLKVDATLKKEGSRIVKVGGEVGDALGDDGKVSDTAKWEYLIPVVFVVPPAGSDAKVRLVAADRILVKAERG